MGKDVECMIALADGTAESAPLKHKTQKTLIDIKTLCVCVIYADNNVSLHY